ncbi:hypothetical protein ACFQ1S_24685 [Kibdelosporangium lantanae]|uniref:Glyoxalase n=1 Tax=Kibdelosporangium lantanae TaxID=1497396 RepID=A0ABW3MFT0_9PSEU
MCRTFDLAQRIVVFRPPPQLRLGLGAGERLVERERVGERTHPLPGALPVDRLRGHGGEPVGEIVDYQDAYWLCYLRGPDGIIVELVEKIG